MNRRTLGTISPLNTKRKTSLIVWDLLTWLLVIFPLMTGGVWIRRPGLWIELTDLGIPVLLVSALGAVFHYRLDTPLENATSVKLFRALWENWHSRLQTAPLKYLFLMGSVWGVLGALASLRRHWAIETHGYDLGIFTNTIWNLSHGFGYLSSLRGGMSLFADHQAPTFWGLAPLFYLFPRAETLLILQAFALASGGIIVFFVARQFNPGNRSLISKDWIPAALPWLYWLYLPFRNANAFDFHPEILMLPLFLGAVAGLQSEARYGKLLGALAFALALGTKESAGPVAAGIGLAWYLGAGPETTRRFTRKAGIFAALSGIAVFYFDIRIVPGLIGKKYLYGEYYSQYGGSPGDLLQAPFRHPRLFFQQLFGPERRHFLFWTLGPLGFLPLLNFRGMIAALPGYLMLFLSAGNQRLNLIYHYAIEPGVGLFFALPAGIGYARDKWEQHRKHAPQASDAWIFLWLLFWSLGLSGRSELFRIRAFSADSHRQWVRSELLPCVDPERPLVASDTLVPQLASRHWIQEESAPNISADCWVSDRSLSHWPLSAEEALGRVPADFQEIFRCGPASVFERRGAASSRSPESACLRCRPKCAPGE